MARKLKTYQTSIGFFDLAIAAPSMKAALEAWGSNSNLFHQGFAKESDDPNTIAATMAKPGVVLKRAVGSEGQFKEDASLPMAFTVRSKSRAQGTKKGKGQSPRLGIDEKAARKAAQLYEQEERTRNRERQKEEAKYRRRHQAVAKAQANIDEAQGKHDRLSGEIDAERSALEKLALTEDERWANQKDRLENALRRARR